MKSAKKSGGTGGGLQGLLRKVSKCALTSHCDAPIGSGTRADEIIV